LSLTQETNGQNQLKHFLRHDKQKNATCPRMNAIRSGKWTIFSRQALLLRLAFAPQAITLSLPNEKSF
jgi:hypothetical protein